MSEMINNMVSIIYVVCLLLFAMTYRLQNATIKKQKQLLDEFYGGNDEVLRFCLHHVLNEAVKNEDYETAIKCKKILDELKKYEATPANPINK